MPLRVAIRSTEGREKPLDVTSLTFDSSTFTVRYKASAINVPQGEYKEAILYYPNGTSEVLSINFSASKWGLDTVTLDGDISMGSNREVVFVPYVRATE